MKDSTDNEHCEANDVEGNSEADQDVSARELDPSSTTDIISRSLEVWLLHVAGTLECIHP